MVVLSHGLWRERFGGSAEVIGKTVTLDGEPHEIVGVMPPEFLADLAAAVATMVIAVIAGMTVPCRRALRVDPAQVLREE